MTEALAGIIATVESVTTDPRTLSKMMVVETPLSTVRETVVLVLSTI